MEKKNQKIMENYSIFSRYIRRQVKKEEEKAKEQGREFTVKQAKSARKKYTRRARIMGASIVTVTLATGFTGYALKSGYQAGNSDIKQIEQETQKQQPTYKHKIIIEPQENKQFDTWKDTLKVNTEQQNNIKENIETEIGELKKSEEIIQYVKQQYVDEYNKNNKQKIEEKDIQITKSNLGEIKKDNNNKYIYDPYANTENSGVYTIKHKGKILEEIARTLIKGDYKQAYRNGEEGKENNTENVYAVVAEGIDYAIGNDNYEKGETSKEVLSTYKNRLINSIYEKEVKENQQTETNQETDEELEQ